MLLFWAAAPPPPPQLLWRRQWHAVQLALLALALLSAPGHIVAAQGTNATSTVAASPPPAASPPGNYTASPNTAGSGATHCCENLRRIGFRSKLPVLVIDTSGSQGALLPQTQFKELYPAVSQEHKVAGSMCTCNSSAAAAVRTDTSVPHRQSDAAAGGEYSGRIAIRIRGSSSARDHAKKGFALDTRQDDGTDREFPLLGEHC